MSWVPAVSLTFIAGIIIKIIIATKMKIKLYYEFDEESRRMYDALKEVLILLSNNKKMWQINSSTRVNTKYNVWAGNNVGNIICYNKASCYKNKLRCIWLEFKVLVRQQL